MLFLINVLFKKSHSHAHTHTFHSEYCQPRIAVLFPLHPIIPFSLRVPCSHSYLFFLSDHSLSLNCGCLCYCGFVIIYWWYTTKDNVCPSTTETITNQYITLHERIGQEEPLLIIGWLLTVQSLVDPLPIGITMLLL